MSDALKPLMMRVGTWSALLDMIGRDEDARRRVLVLAFSVASADGAMQEIEENLVWRVGSLLGFDDAAINAIRETQTPSP